MKSRTGQARLGSARAFPVASPAGTPRPSRSWRLRRCKLPRAARASLACQTGTFIPVSQWPRSIGSLLWVARTIPGFPGLGRGATDRVRPRSGSWTPSSRTTGCLLERSAFLDLAVPEAALVKRFLFAQHVVDGPRQPGGQDAQHLGRAVPLRLLLLPPFGPLAAAQKETRGLGEGPAQMRITDLLAARAELLPR